MQTSSLRSKGRHFGWLARYGLIAALLVLRRLTMRLGLAGIHVPTGNYGRLRDADHGVYGYTAKLSATGVTGIHDVIGDTEPEHNMNLRLQTHLLMSAAILATDAALGPLPASEGNPTNQRPSTP